MGRNCREEKEDGRMGTGEKNGTGLAPLIHLTDETQACISVTQRGPLGTDG